MDIADQPTYQRYRKDGTSTREVVFAMLVFASVGAITWAIRGSNGWNGIDGTIVPGMTWGILWWYVCWRKGVDARGVPLWLGLGIALGGELGYGQYVSWIRGMFNVGDEIVPVSPWTGYAWFAMCGVAWGATGGIALGWAIAGRKPLGVWLTRLVLPVGVALLARCAVQTWPWLFFPNWDLGVYVAKAGGGFDPTAAANTQRHMTVAWLASAVVSAIAWFATTKVARPSRASRSFSVCAVGAVIVLLLVVVEWLFFSADQLGLFAGRIGHHLGRTVYTNSQNAIVVGWWIGALGVAVIQRDRYTLFAGLVIGVGFGIGFPLAALWCLGYAYWPQGVDWWKMWELQAGFHLGLLYVVVLFWAIRQVGRNNKAGEDEEVATFGRWCETLAMAFVAFLVVYVMSREDFLAVGTLLGLFFVVAISFATIDMDGVVDRRRGVAFVYSGFLLVFIMVWGVSSRAGILLGLYDANAVDQYAWPTARMAIFAPAGVLVVSAAMLQTWQAIRNPRFALCPGTAASRISARVVDLMTFTGVVGAASIWPEKIGVLYALFLGLALFALNRLNRHLHDADAWPLRESSG